MEELPHASEEFIKAAKEEKWYTSYHDMLNEILNKIAPDTQVLAEKFEHYTFTKEEFENATLFDIKKCNYRFNPMEKLNCHNNSVRLCIYNPFYNVYTGYVLHKDGIWTFHSWVVDRNNLLIETSEMGLLYYGIKMDKIF